MTKRPKYKEMYEWEKASHYATEQELKRFKKMYAELFEKFNELNTKNIIGILDTSIPS